MADKKDFSESKPLKKSDVVPDPVDEDDAEAVEKAKFDVFEPAYKF